MISVQRHMAEQLILRFRSAPENYGLHSDDGDGVVVTFHRIPFCVGGGYLQIFGPLTVVIAMSEIMSIAFLPAYEVGIREGSLIGVE